MQALLTPFHPQLRWNSSMANSPDKARVYRATIAPLVQSAAHICRPQPSSAAIVIVLTLEVVTCLIHLNTRS